MNAVVRDKHDCDVSIRRSSEITRRPCAAVLPRTNLKVKC